jgi:ABC-2 type transport system ATP-binding protein
MWEHIRGINKERNITIFLTTHYLEEADSLCSRIAIIDHGKIKVSGSPSELKSGLGGDVLEMEVSDGPDLEGLFRLMKGVREVNRSGNRYRIRFVRIDQSLQGIFDH